MYSSLKISDWGILVFYHCNINNAKKIHLLKTQTQENNDHFFSKYYCNVKEMG